jgi:ABC-2 type transport system ATP-binding protein
MRERVHAVGRPAPRERPHTLSEQKPTLKLERVTKRFGDFTAVDELSLTVRAGRVYGLLGPNGAGKTTTIRMIVGITAPDEGTLELFGRPVSAESQNRIGYLPEERGLYKRMKVADQLRFFAELKNFSGREADEAIDRWLAKVRLSDWKRKKSSELSNF